MTVANLKGKNFSFCVPKMIEPCRGRQQVVLPVVSGWQILVCDLVGRLSCGMVHWREGMESGVSPGLVVVNGGGLSRCKTVGVDDVEKNYWNCEVV